MSVKPLDIKIERLELDTSRLPVRSTNETPVSIKFIQNSANPFRKKNKFIITNENDQVIGSATDVVWPPLREPGRPPEDNRLVAIFLAFHLALGQKRKIGEARIWAAKILRYGKKQTRTGAGTADADLERFIREKLKSPRINGLTAGHVRVILFVDKDPDAFQCYLLRDNFEQKIALRNIQISGTGWRWFPGDKTAIYGRFSITGNNFLPTSAIDLEGDGNW